MPNLIRNGLGAFADCAVLFPLLVLLGANGLFSPVILFLSAGAIYLAAGAYFKIPMSVQPLKSIAIGALAMGASSMEIRWAAALLGLFCVLLVALRWERFLSAIPARVVHQVQVGLAALLLIQAFRCLDGSAWPVLSAAVGISVLILVLPSWRGIPWMGIFAVWGIAYAVWNSVQNTAPIAHPVEGANELRFAWIASLVLPQIALTLANSVVGTRAAAQNYFGEKADRVTYRALCNSIGLGNLLMAIIGGLPFCHGSGGLTAHVKGGAISNVSNYVIGSFLLLLGIISWGTRTVTLVVPVAFVGALLFVTGIQHLALARETAKTSIGKASLVLAFFLAAYTQNLLWVLGAGLFLEGLRKVFSKNRIFIVEDR